jgi:inhibitor of Bruton tyrosine kinase
MVYLWQYFLQDNLEAFRHYLADATFIAGSLKAPGSHGSNKDGSPALPSTSPKVTFMRNRKSLEHTGKVARTHGKQDQRSHLVNLTRADVNAKDAYGRTLLHHAASSSSPNALGFVKALLEVPFIDLYIQDLESGWTALHRALYNGHISIAQALMLRDANDSMGYITNALNHVPGGLIKIKDHEGNSPFEVFTLTVAPRDLQHSAPICLTLAMEDTSSVDSIDAGDPENDDRASRRLVRPKVNLLGDEVFAFGSNKNLNLGLGDEDNRHFPEQVTLNRPDHLLYRLYVDAQARRVKELGNQDLSSSQILFAEAANTVPAVISNQRVVIQDVVMSKLHTAIITTDPESNLYVCGFGPGGRLGTGDESTRFSYVCLQTGGLSNKHVVVVALGQDHSIAVCEQGEVYTWGSNRFGQLGYSLPPSNSPAKDNPTQLTPRQLFGSMKKEMIIGAAASSIHSVIFTSTALYTFGKNEGQLGLMDADARSLEIQVAPRRVGVSILQSPISMVSAIDRATTILLESHDVVVLTHYGWTKVVFQLEGFTNVLSGASATRYDPVGNLICKITSGGNSICAMSTFGEVFTVDVTKKPDALATNQSTTNPSKARNALPQPSKLWSIGKPHMAATDVAVGQDGSIILCTVSGSVWRKEKRAKIKVAGAKGNAAKPKDYKFVRIPNINRAVGVRSNAYGAYAAIRKDCDVARQQIVVERQTIWDTMFTMLPFRDLANDRNDEDSDTENPRPRFWTPSTSVSSPAHIKQAILLSEDIERQVQMLMSKYEPLSLSQYDLWVTSTLSDVRIPAHSFLVKGRSRILRQALTEFQSSYYFCIPDVLSIEYGPDGHINLVFIGADIFTILNFVFYLYTENIVDVWHHSQRTPHLAPRYRQIRSELMKIGGSLDMGCLERAARVMTEPARCLHLDMNTALMDSNLFQDADVRIDLANDVEVPAHSALLSRRCPFFEGLFIGRAGGSWLNSRRDRADEMSDLIRVDLKHVEEQVFRMVLRHIYVDAGEELFDDVVTADLDEFIDLIIEVMAVSNELMLDRLSQVCQKMLGQYVTTRNICQLLNAVAPCSVNEFKHAGLEYICMNLETMLEHRLLEELDDDLLAELDETVQENQQACFRFTRSGRAEAELFDQHPELEAQIVVGKQRMIDSLRLRSRVLDSEDRIASARKLRPGGSERTSLTPSSSFTKQPMTDDRQCTETNSAVKSQAHGADMFFEMEDEHPAVSLIDPPASASAVDNNHLHEEALLHNGSPLSSRQYRPLDSGLLTHSIEDSVDRPKGSLLRKNHSSSSMFATSPNAVVTLSEGGETISKVWHSPVIGSAKMNFQEIMAQASSASKTSNLTMAINQDNAQLRRAPHRPSQRERKKIQHQRSKEAIINSLEEVSNKSHQTDVSLHSRSSVSPWQTVQKPADNPFLLTRSGGDSVATQPSPRSGMTMRQTVAGASAIAKDITPVKPKAHPQSVSTPSLGQPSNPQIQSIRHTPASVSASGSPLGMYHSLAEILVQQQGDKAAIREAAAKRSLQDIQQEQEFQEWWDNETKKVQEEEQGSTIDSTRKSKGERGRGRGRGKGGRRKGSGRGGGAASANETELSKVTGGPAPGDENTSGPSKRRPRERGRRGDRGERGRSRGQ